MEPPRRIMTRARAKADGDQSTFRSATSTRPKKSIPEKRKAFPDSDCEQQISAGIDQLATTKSNPPSKTATTGLKAAPSRKSTRSTVGSSKSITSVPKITSTLRSTKPAKKVKFLNSTSEDKENAPPPKDEPIDEIQLSKSISALSVKPKRVPKSKLKQPTGSLEDLLPALSPKKAIRLHRPIPEHRDDMMMDDLDCPTSPGLSVKPRRPMKPLSPSKDISKGADLLLGNSTLKTSVLFGSPARRIPPSPLKSVPKEDSPMKKTGLSSPARRPAGGILRNEASNKKPSNTIKGKGSSLKFSIAADCEDPFGEDDVTTAPLSIGRKLFAKPEAIMEAPSDTLTFEDLMKPEERKPAAISQSSQVRDYEDFNRRVSNFLAPMPSVPTTPPTPPSKTNQEMRTSPTPAPSGRASKFQVDNEGDVGMDGPESYNSTTSLSPTPASKFTSSLKKHLSPSEGGSSFGFFGFDDDEDDQQDEDAENVAPPQATAVVSLADKFSGIELDRQRRKSGSRGFGQALDISPWRCSYADKVADEMHIDPALLAQETYNDHEDEIVVGYSESPVKRTLIPLKGGDDEQDSAVLFSQKVTWTPPKANQGSPMDKDSRRKRRSSGFVGPLNGATVYVEVYTTDGSNVGSGFEDKLRRLGARIIKQWNWNPTAGTPISKVGITHVVFKDGSARTLQKVKETQGAVTCVGLGWVVACAEAHDWVQESNFHYDLDDVPRGGRRRRKSMEPNAARDSMRSSASPVPTTPEKANASPIFPKTEPHKARDYLTQMTPQLGEKLMIARRKSMQFAPKIGSPLARVPWNAH
ncbi:hypothetical protein EDC01DRAFT_467551 [Geopyxis carbonaria]|nr:hypothetical protein EDC01DRAFT_467551 [Geopyxis carbonaria]